jgi:lipopolysaccharide/colanic/teichoic acid biosynthesis glycosyltransferase
MNSSSEPPGPEDLEAMLYWSRASDPATRWQMKLQLALKKNLWRAVVDGSSALKRLLDIVASGGGLLTLSPLFLVVALIIRRDGGPVFFCQQRVGRFGQTFGMWKFRSMVPNADALKDQLLQQNEVAGGVIFKMKDDPRITPIGRFIRKYSIDELPQLWNVFCGEMSLVGPRPPVPREVALYSVEERRRLMVRPGLTCFWQVGGRSDIDFAGQVRLDLEYIRSESIWVDLKLLFLTIPAVLLGKGAY